MKTITNLFGLIFIIFQIRLSYIKCDSSTNSTSTNEAAKNETEKEKPSLGI